MHESNVPLWLRLRLKDSIMAKSFLQPLKNSFMNAFTEKSAKTVPIEDFLAYIRSADSTIRALVTHWIFALSEAEASTYWEECKNVLSLDIYAFMVSQTADEVGAIRKALRGKFPPCKNPTFTFIDLFAGIGGFRIAMQENGGRCVFSSEWNPAAQETYAHNFGETPFGDITLASTKSLIPEGFDILCAGFPCQAFSIAGYQKGFEDTRGTLFFDVAKILESRRPRAFFLENVKNLQTHDHGKTFRTIMKVLEEDLGYKVFTKVMSPDQYADLPQNRERIFIVGFDPAKVPQVAIDAFRFPSATKLKKGIRDCIDETVSAEEFFYTPKYGCYEAIVKGVVRTDTVYQWRRQYVRENKSNVCPTLTANMGAGGHNVPLIRVKDGVRKLTPRECLNFQGFPASYEFPHIAPSKCYMQAGNSVAVPLISRVTAEIVRVLNA